MIMWAGPVEKSERSGNDVGRNEAGVMRKSVVVAPVAPFHIIIIRDTIRYLSDSEYDVLFFPKRQGHWIGDTISNI